MKSILENIIRLRNPKFKFDENLNHRILFEFFFNQLIATIRGSKMLFKGKMPRRMLLNKGVTWHYIHQITFGNFLKLGKNVTLSALGTEGISIGNNVSIGSDSKVIVSTSLNNIGIGITIEDNVGIGEYAYLGGAGGLSIGRDCIIGQYFSCHPENHNFNDQTKLIREQGVTRKGIVIHSNCWIGSKVTILDGVEIGANSVIAAGAVVTKSFPKNSIIGGVPAKKIH